MRYSYCYSISLIHHLTIPIHHFPIPIHNSSPHFTIPIHHLTIPIHNSYSPFHYPYSSFDYSSSSFDYSSSPLHYSYSPFHHSSSQFQFTFHQMVTVEGLQLLHVFSISFPHPPYGTLCVMATIFVTRGTQNHKQVHFHTLAPCSIFQRINETRLTK